MSKQQLRETIKCQQYDRISAARILIILLKLTGLWHWQEGGNDAKEFQPYHILEYILRIVLHIPFSFIYISLMWVAVFTATDLDQAGDNLYMCFTEVALIVKILNIWHYSEMAWNFINELSFSKTYDLLNLEEIELWQGKQKQFLKIIIIFLIGSIAAVVAAGVGVLFAKDYELPFAFWVPFQWQTNIRNYWIAYVYNMLGIIVTGAANCSLDMMGCYMIFHVGLLYKILGLRLNRLTAMGNDDVVVELRKIFKFHKSIKRMTKVCQTLVSSYVLSQIILSALILCFCGYRIQKMNILQNLGQFFSMLQFIIVLLLEIYLPCYFGNEIILSSSELCTHLYSSDWLKCSIPTRKLINLYMEFIKHPEKIKAGNYFEVGLPVFTKVINNAYSFFALLINVDK